LDALNRSTILAGSMREASTEADDPLSDSPGALDLIISALCSLMQEPGLARKPTRSRGQVAFERGNCGEHFFVKRSPRMFLI
jgi:hypothetical protein